jgi:hypothetical protein
MKDAEKKWEEFFEKSQYRDLNYNREMFAIRDFKQALREAIEAEIKLLEN